MDVTIPSTDCLSMVLCGMCEFELEDATAAVEGCCSSCSMG